MLGFLPPVARGVIAFLLLLLNTLFWCALLFTLALVRLVLPFKAVRVRIDPLLNAIATAWIACNSGWMRLTQRTHWDVQGVDELPYHGWYLVNCNHQCAVDIFVLQHVLNRRIPLLKFFLKQQLIYVPVIGLAWWALDFPFMKRHSKAALRTQPRLARAGPRDHPPRLRKVRPGADQRHELCRRHALHAGQTRGAGARPTATCSSPRPARWRWRCTPWASSSTRWST